MRGFADVTFICVSRLSPAALVQILTMPTLGTWVFTRVFYESWSPFLYSLSHLHLLDLLFCSRSVAHLLLVLFSIVYSFLSLAGLIFLPSVL